MKNRKNVLITGACGYLGTHLVARILENNLNVIALDLSREKPMNVEYYYVGDFSDEILINHILNNHEINYVVHLAALKNVSESFDKPQLYFHENAIKTNLLWTYCRNTVDKFIAISSAAVYEEYSSNCREDFDVNPISPYGQSKLEMERKLQESNQFISKLLIFRLFNLAGVYTRINKAQGAVNVICQSIINGQEFFINTTESGENISTRDYIDVQDVCDVVIQALEIFPPKQKYTIYNLGRGTPITLKEIIDRAEFISNKKLSIKRNVQKTQEIRTSCANIDRLNSDFGSFEFKTIDETIRKTLVFYDNLR